MLNQINISSVEDLQQHNLHFLTKDLLSNDSAYYSLRAKVQKHYNELLNKGWNDRPYQVEFATLYGLRRNNICALSLGLGKTIIAGLHIAALYQDKLHSFRPGAIQVVCPSYLSLEFRWLEDLHKLSVLSPYLSVINSPQQIKSDKSPIWLYTIDFPKRKSKNINGTIAKEISRRGLCPNLLIIDEAHLLKEGSQRTQQLQIIRNKTKRVLLLSGTISDGRLDLLDFLCRFTYRQHWLFSSKDFVKSFSVNKTLSSNYLYGSNSTQNNKTFSTLSSSKLRDYNNILNTFIHRSSYSDPDIYPFVSLPKRDTLVEKIDAYYDHKLYYNSIINSHLNSINKLANSSQSKSIITKILQIIHPILEASSTPPSHIPNRKLDILLDYVSEYYSLKKKTAIFIRSVASGRLITNTLRSIYSPQEVIRVYSQDSEFNPPKQSLSERNKAIDSFLFKDASIGVFSYKLCSESINLTSAEQIIFYDYPWSATFLSQALHRVVRPGSIADVVREVYLYNLGFIDEHQVSLLAEKLNSASLLLDLDDFSSSLSNSSIDFSLLLKNISQFSNAGEYSRI